MSADDEVEAIATVVLAFSADPVTRWTWPHSHQYLAAMPRFVRAFGGGAFTHGGAYCTSEYTGAALWLPPGVHPDEGALGELMKSTASAAAREEGPAIFELMTKYHPTEPHWYLPLIGVDPAHQGKGHGDVDAVRARAVRSRPGARVSGIHQPAEYLPLPAPRLQGCRHDTGRFVTNTGPHVETLRLMQHACADVSVIFWLANQRNTGL